MPSQSSTDAQGGTLFVGSMRAGKVHAVRDLSFKMERGQVTGFVGPNGGARHERSIEATPDHIVIDDCLVVLRAEDPGTAAAKRRK